MSGCVLDTDVVIAALDRSDSHHVRAARAIAWMIDEGTALHLSLVNYAETLVRPAEEEATLARAISAVAAWQTRLVVPTPAIAVDAARYRSLSISLADGFALATAKARGSSVATFDRRVRRAAARVGLELAELA